MNTAATSPTNEKQILITRVINAPRERVFRAWTDPEQLPKWYCPHGCTIEFRTLDARAGGGFHSCTHTPTGYTCWCKGVYLELVPPERIVHTLIISDEHGNTLTATEAGMNPEWPTEALVTVTFEDLGGKTRLTLAHNVSEALAMQTGAYPSWLQMFDRLEAIATQD